jgi:hypothetical protein
MVRRRLLRSSTMVQSRHFNDPTGLTLHGKGSTAQRQSYLVIGDLAHCCRRALDGRCPSDARQHGGCRQTSIQCETVIQEVRHLIDQSFRAPFGAFGVSILCVGRVENGMQAPRRYASSHNVQ